MATPASPSSDAAPESFCCPITKELMRDPVMAADGNSYERSAITHWLGVHGTSPLTRERMSPADLRPNRALLTAISDWLTAHPSAVSSHLPVDASHGSHAPRETPSESVRFLPEPVAVSVQVAGLSGVDIMPDEFQSSGLIAVTLTPPVKGDRKPVALIAVLDTSGSMAYPGEEVKSHVEGSVFSRMDFVKHSMRTVMAMMTADDVLAIVEFSNRGVLKLRPTAMDGVGKAAAEGIIASMKPDENTNLYDGLRLGLETAKLPECVARNAVLLLLTDGEANVSPPRGILPTYERLRADAAIANVPVHTFGFGYDLDSAMLSSLAALSGGSFGYISDASMVGTVFINFLAYTLSCAARRTRVSISPPRGGSVKILGVRSGSDAPLGAVQFGQERVIVAEFNSASAASPHVDVKVDVDGIITEQRVSLIPDGSVHLNDLTYAWVRSSLANACQHTLEQCATGAPGSRARAAAEMSAFAGWAAAHNSERHDPRLAAIGLDLNGPDHGQIGKALERDDWYKRWGRHYLASLMRAHVLQICINFKDASVQAFGGEPFRVHRDAAETLFLELPSPTPSCQAPRRGSSTSTSTAAPRAPVSMASYLNAHGGCFAHDTLVPVMTARGVVHTRMDAVKRGDALCVSPLGTPGEVVVRRVLALLRTRTRGCATLCRIADGVHATPWHPVFDSQSNAWRFACDVAPTKLTAYNHVFNIMLEEPHGVALRVGSGDSAILAAALGHGATGVATLSHAYLGTRAVLEDVQTMVAQQTGEQALTVRAVRCSVTSGIVGLVLQEEWEDCTDALALRVHEAEPAAEMVAQA